MQYKYKNVLHKKITQIKKMCKLKHHEIWNELKFCNVPLKLTQTKQAW
jgi:hypothetical protein